MWLRCLSQLCAGFQERVWCNTDRLSQKELHLTTSFIAMSTVLFRELKRWCTKYKNVNKAALALSAKAAFAYLQNTPRVRLLHLARGVMKALCGSLFLHSLLSVYNVDTSRQTLELAVDSDTVQCVYAVLLCGCVGSSRVDTTGTFTDYNPIGQHVSV